MEKYLFTSESVTEGHPDKICDIISDTILDEALKQDSKSKMAVEVTIKDDLILIYGEAKTTAKLNYKSIALDCIKKIGYKEKYNVIEKISEQSLEINRAVTKKDGRIGAGDQGIMFGYACMDTENYMPAPIEYANRLAKRLSIVQKEESNLGPDGKTQVTVEYIDGKVNRIDSIVISTQHTSNFNYEKLYEIILKKVIKKVIPNKYLDSCTNIIINPSGSFVKGGSFGDSGTTGRKIICDTYGGVGRIGGGCLSSKDPSKVDRSAAYYCRYVAKNIVANKLAEKCEIQVAYVIGQERPISIYVNTFSTSEYTNDEIIQIINNNFDFSVNNIISELNLLEPIYSSTSCYGHFGNNSFPWEKIIDLKV